MEDIRRIAFETVLRGCAFASLAIFCIMIGFSFEPRIAFKTGGVLTLLMIGVLVLKAREARTKDYRRTELWLYLTEEQRPPKAYAQYVSSMVLRETYLTFAYWTALISIGMWVLAIFFSIADTVLQQSVEIEKSIAALQQIAFCEALHPVGPRFQ